MSNNNDIDKFYVSPYDKFLYHCESERPKTASQLKEINKHKRIALLRDNAEAKEVASEIWRDF